MLIIDREEKKPTAVENENKFDAAVIYVVCHF